MYVDNFTKWKYTLWILSSPPGAELFERTLMGHYMRQKHFSIYYHFYKYAVELSPVYSSILSINHDRGGVKGVKGYGSKRLDTILGGQSQVYWFLTYFFSSLHVKHHLQEYSNEFSTSDIINDNLFIFIKAGGCSSALPPAFIRQRVVTCPIRLLK